MKATYVKTHLQSIVNVSKIVTVHYYEFDKNFIFRGESHDFWEMVYVDRGEISIYAGESRHHLKQGEVVFHQPNEFHSIAGAGAHGASVFIITFDCHSSAMQFFRERIDAVPQDLLSLMKRLNC